MRESRSLLAVSALLVIAAVTYVLISPSVDIDGVLHSQRHLHQATSAGLQAGIPDLLLRFRETSRHQRLLQTFHAPYPTVTPVLDLTGTYLS